MSKVWFITGTTGGLGREIALAALRAGDRVAATGRDAGRVERALADSGAGERLLALPLDVGDEAQVRGAVRTAVERFGRIDVLVNNAGYGLFGGIEEANDAEVRRQFDVNVFGTLAVVRAALPFLRAQRSGRILNVSSVAGLVGMAGWGIYCATKFALEGLSEALAREVEPFGLRVTALEFGYVRTNFMSSGLVTAANPLAEYAELRQAHADVLTADGQQIGDPARGAQAVLSVATMAEPPVHLVLGSDAHGLAVSKYREMLAGLERDRALAFSTDFTDR